MAKQTMLGRLELIKKLEVFERQLEDIPGTGKPLITATISYLQRNYNHDEVMQGAAKTIRLALYEFMQQGAALNIERFFLWVRHCDTLSLIKSRDGWMKTELETCLRNARLSKELTFYKEIVDDDNDLISEDAWTCVERVMDLPTKSESKNNMEVRANVVDLVTKYIQRIKVLERELGKIKAIALEALKEKT